MTKRSLRSLILVLPLVLLGACDPLANAPPVKPPPAPAPSPRTYQSEDGGFEVQFPPTGEIETERTDDGGHSVTVATGASTFSVSWFDLPAHVLDEKGAAGVLQEVEDGRRKNKTAVEKRSELTTQGAPSRLFVWTSKEHDVRLCSLIVLAGKRLFQIDAGTGLGADPKELEPFVRSFRIR